MPKTNQDEISARKIAKHFSLWQQKTGKSVLGIAALSRTEARTVRALLNEGVGTVRTLLRIARAMDCELVLTHKTGRRMEVWDDPEAEEQLFKLKEKQKIYKRDERNRKDSRRQEFDRAERERDFTADDDAE
jgi:hypothetical protein